MPKNFQKLPKSIVAEVANSNSELVEVRSVLRVEPDSLVNFADYEFQGREFLPGESWSLIPPAKCGKTSKKNVEGWSVTRKDLPKYTKTFCHEIQNFGDGSTYGYSIACREMEVYHKDVYSPPNHRVKVTIEEIGADGKVGLYFCIEDLFAKSDPDFSVDLLFAVNILQEYLGNVEVSAPQSPRSYHTEALDWELFPPEEMEDLIASLNAAGKLTSENQKDVARSRLALFERFRPLNYLRGMSGSTTYIGAKYADDLVVFENIEYGNALYLMYDNWEDLSKLPRSRLSKMSGDKLDRIVHKQGWEEILKGLLRAQLKKRRISWARR